jgi:hypothetical protein
MIDFENNPAFLLLLSKFVSPRCLENLQPRAMWQDALKNDPAVVLNQLFDEGYLQSADLISILPSTFGSTELKKMAKERGVPFSGTKDVLAKRLVKADAEGMAKLVDVTKYFVCSEKGWLAAVNFENAERDKKRRAEQESVELLQKGQFQDACLKIAAYENSKISKRGVGIDWASHSFNNEISILKFLFSSVPKRFAGTSEEKLAQLRVAAGADLLWGVPISWLYKPDLDEIGLDSDAAAMSLLAGARHKQQIQTMKAAGIKIVEILGGGSCAECEKQAGKIYDIDKVPEIPFENCTCENGHLCFAIAKA